MAEFYPVFVDLRGRSCLVVGAGAIAEMKVVPLLDSGADVTLVAPWATPGLVAMAERGALTWHRRVFRDEDAVNRFLIVAATDDREVNRRVFELAEAEQRLVNVVDDPPLCNFIVPAIAQSGPVQVAVSTSGRSPTLAGRLRNAIRDQFLGGDTGILAEWLGRWRLALKQRLGSFEVKRGFWGKVLDSEIPQLVRSGREAEAERRLAAMMESYLEKV